MTPCSEPNGCSPTPTRWFAVVRKAQSERASAQRTVEKLTQQRNSVAAYLEELRGLLTTETASALEGITPMQERPLALDEGEASAADLPSASQD